MKRLRCTTQKDPLTIRATPGGKDTGARIMPREIVEGHGESYDRGWQWIVAGQGSGWASSRYFENVPAEPAAPAVPFGIVSRAAWGSKAGARQGVNRMKPGPHVMVYAHHFATPDVPANATEEQERQAMRSVETFHLGKKWAGLGYSFVIFNSGRIYEGRGWGIVGAHTEGHNSTAHGIAFGIDGSKHSLTEAAIASFRALVAAGVRQGHVAEEWKLDGHRSVGQTTCPGDKIVAQFARLRAA